MNYTVTKSGIASAVPPSRRPTKRHATSLPVLIRNAYGLPSHALASVVFSLRVVFWRSRPYRRLRQLLWSPFGRRYIRPLLPSTYRFPVNVIYRTAVGLVLISLSVQLVSPWLRPSADAYALTPAAQKLLGPANSALTAKISYDAKQASFFFNQSGIKSTAYPACHSCFAHAQLGVLFHALVFYLHLIDHKPL